MSHEWHCRCPRCEADEAKYTGDDPADDDTERCEASAASEGPTGLAAFYSARMA